VATHAKREKRGGANWQFDARRPRPRCYRSGAPPTGRLRPGTSPAVRFVLPTYTSSGSVWRQTQRRWARPTRSATRQRYPGRHHTLRVIAGLRRQAVSRMAVPVEWRPQPSAPRSRRNLAGHLANPWGDKAGGIGRGKLAPRLLGRHSATVNLVFAESWQETRDRCSATCLPAAASSLLGPWTPEPQAANMSISSLQTWIK